MAFKLVILGGGTSGWVTAALLNAVHNRRGARPIIDITLIEAPGGRIGVGEATVPSLLRTLHAIGVDEREFLARTEATFKQGILFRHWRDTPADAPNNAYFHGFDVPRTHQNLPLARAWAARYDSGDPTIGAFAEATGIQAGLIAAGRAPKRLDQPSYEGMAGYAYHLDAELLADFLAEICVSRGVRRISDQVRHVHRNEQGGIAALETEQHGAISGDLYVDCSGFRGYLIHQTLGVPFHSDSDILLCDRAVALRVPHAEHASLRPYTQATAQDAGWTWDIPLQSRRGCGYVYSSQFLADDAAESVLRSMIGPAAEGQNARLLPMRVGHSALFWEQNCVAIGLAGGFLEPLESTGISLVEFGASMLGENFPFGGSSPILADHYNRAMTAYYEEILDFINLHYCLSRRRDTAFWRAATASDRITDRLAERLAFWSERPPRAIDGDSALKMFASHNWEAILYGMGWRPRLWSGMHGQSLQTDFAPAFAAIRAEQAKTVATLPEHAAFLRQYRA